MFSRIYYNGIFASHDLSVAIVNDNLQQMAKTIYDYWFLQFEFPNENGKPYKSSGGKMVWNEELKRNIPKKFKVADIFTDTVVWIDIMKIIKAINANAAA